jgi:hypothetical protein
MRFFFFFSLFFLFFQTFVVAQNSEFKHAFNYKIIITDYCSLDKQYRDERAARPRFMYADDINYAAEIGYLRFINKNFNLKTAMRLGTVDAYHIGIVEGDSTCQPCNRRLYPQEFFGSLEINGIYKFNNGYIFPENFIVQPYLLLGLSAVYFEKRNEHFDLQIPMGLGMNLRIAPQMSLQSQMEYRQAFFSKKNNLAVTFGILWLIGKPQIN